LQKYGVYQFTQRNIVEDYLVESSTTTTLCFDESLIKFCNIFGCSLLGAQQVMRLLCIYM